MTSHAPIAEPPNSGFARAVTKIGIPAPLALGFVGLLLFMIGDGVEAGFIAPFLANNGAHNDVGAAEIISVYGIAVMVASWLSGALSQLWGPRKVMILGFIIWLVFDVLFLAIAVPTESYGLMLLFYGIRGFGYPLFAYSFLVWINNATPFNKLGAAVGWYYFAFTGGLPTLGSLVASFTNPVLGHLGTLWLSVAILAVGGLLVFFGVRERSGFSRLSSPEEKPMTTLLSSISLVWTNPKVGMGAIARFINSVPTFGFLVFFPTVFADDIGFGEHRWLLLVSVTFGSCIFFNLMSGILSDKLGWRNTVFWLGCVGCTISMLTLYFIPAAVGADHYWVALLCGIFFGLTLSGWVPLSALVPSLAPENKGGAMALLNLGAGASAFVGPALVGLLLGPIGPGGLVIVFSGLYAVAAALVWFCRLPEDHAHLSAHAADEVPEPVVAVTTPV